MGKACTYAHGQAELTAWNEHLKRMEKEIKKRTEKEIEMQKDDDSAGKSEVSPPAIKHDLPIPSYQVGYQAINTISEKKKHYL